MGIELKKCVRVFLFKESQYLAVVSHKSREFLEGLPFGRVVPLLDGSRDLAALVRELPDLPGEIVRTTIRRLDELDLLADSTDLAQPLTLLVDSLGIARTEARDRLVSTPVTIRSSHADAVATLSHELKEMGIRRSAGSGFTVFLADDYLREEYHEFNRNALESNAPWMMIQPFGLEPWIGPQFHPGETACWECLARRLREHRWLEFALMGPYWPDGVPFPAASTVVPSLSGAALSLAAIEIVKWVLGRPSLRNAVSSIDPITATPRLHPLRRDPGCPSCSRAVQSGSNASESGSRTTASNVVHRRSESLLERLECLVSPITGIIENCDPVEPNQSPVHLFTADFVLPLQDDRLADATRGRFPAATGRGESREAARTGCLAEAVERYSAVYRGTEPTLRCTAAALGGAAVPLGRLAPYSESQYASRRGRPDGSDVPDPVEPDTEIDWIELGELSTGVRHFLPAEFCYLLYPEQLYRIPMAGDTNGCAAAGSFEEAVVRGFLELVERDAVALWWLCRIPRHSVEPDHAKDPVVQSCRFFLKEQGCRLHLLDITSDLDIPVVVAYCTKNEEAGSAFGLGAHCNPRIAVVRAVTELITVCYNDKAVRRAFDHPFPLEDSPHLVPQSPVESSMIPLDTGGPTLESVDDCLALVRHHGLEVFALNMTRPETEVPVAKVMIPGLCHYRPWLAARRLYEVPVKLGWLRRAPAEGDLNPLPLPL